MENKETSPLLDNRIDELMMSFGNSMSQGKFKNGEMSSVLISLLDKCTVVLNDVPTESDQYSYNLDIVIKSIAYSANHAIKNMGNQDALYIPITGLQYGKSLADEYKILFSKINSLQISDNTQKTIETEFPYFISIVNSTEQIKKKSEGCYIATAVYGSYEHSQVMLLRGFRDNTLNKSSLGKKIIELYYSYSPSLAAKLKNRHILTSIIRYTLDQFIKIIK